jgi:hypothetical protein
MSQWVVAYCTRPVVDLALDEIAGALDVADFATMAEHQGLDEDVGYAAEDSLRFEALTAARERALLVHYRHHAVGDTWMRCDFHAERAFLADTIASVLDADPPPRARALVPTIVQTVAFDLKGPDMEGMGLPIAFHLAMWLARPERGDGLVEVEGEWWDPRTHERL